MNCALNRMDFIKNTNLPIDQIAREHFDHIMSLYDINKDSPFSSTTSISISNNVVTMINIFTNQEDLQKFCNIVHDNYLYKYGKHFRFECQVNGFVVSTTVECLGGDCRNE